MPGLDIIIKSIDKLTEKVDKMDEKFDLVVENQREKANALHITDVQQQAQIDSLKKDVEQIQGGVKLLGGKTLDAIYKIITGILLGYFALKGGTNVGETHGATKEFSKSSTEHVGQK